MQHFFESECIGFILLCVTVTFFKPIALVLLIKYFMLILGVEGVCLSVPSCTRYSELFPWFVAADAVFIEVVQSARL